MNVLPSSGGRKKCSKKRSSGVRFRAQISIVIREALSFWERTLSRTSPSAGSSSRVGGGARRGHRDGHCRSIAICPEILETPVPGAATPQLAVALTLLRRAKEAAAHLRLDPWQLALGIRELLAVGLSGTDIRCLLARGLAAHAREHSPPGARRRSFCPIENLTLPPQTCLILTDAGERLLKRWESRPGATAAGASPATPIWDGGPHQLWYRGRLVKWYRAPAVSQEAILAAFQEEGWPLRIIDPLRQIHGLDPRERLHEGVKGLNRGQVERLLVFRRDGTGEGVTWRAREGQSDKAGS
jgi:hypothetical protein